MERMRRAAAVRPIGVKILWSTMGNVEQTFFEMVSIFIIFGSTQHSHLGFMDQRLLKIVTVFLTLLLKIPTDNIALLLVKFTARRR